MKKNERNEEEELKTLCGFLRYRWTQQNPSRAKEMFVTILQNISLSSSAGNQTLNYRHLLKDQMTTYYCLNLSREL